VARGVRRRWRHGPLPELVVEPGRCLASPNQLLLLGVQRVKRRAGVGTWVVVDGGLGTVSMPTYYEAHEILLADDVRRPRSMRATVIGPVCFAGDVVVRHQPLPEVVPGEVLAVMDSGAYFTALESSFGFARPAVVGVADGRARLLRRRETFDDMVARDASPRVHPCPHPQEMPR
jgi:diaminopimelate decarboxylase